MYLFKPHIGDQGIESLSNPPNFDIIKMIQRCLNCMEIFFINCLPKCPTPQILSYDCLSVHTMKKSLVLGSLSLFDTIKSYICMSKHNEKLEANEFFTFNRNGI